MSESDARHNGPHGRAGTTSHRSRSGRPSRLSSTIAIARTATLKPRTVAGPGIEESWCRHRRDRYRAGGCTQQSRILLHSVAHRSARTTRGRGLLHSDTNISRSPQVKQRVRCAKVSRFEKRHCRWSLTAPWTAPGARPLHWHEPSITPSVGRDVGQGRQHYGSRRSSSQPDRDLPKTPRERRQITSISTLPTAPASTAVCASAVRSSGKRCRGSPASSPIRSAPSPTAVLTAATACALASGSTP